MQKTIENRLVAVAAGALLMVGLLALTGFLFSMTAQQSNVQRPSASVVHP